MNDEIIVETDDVVTATVIDEPVQSPAEKKFKQAARSMRVEARKLRDDSGMTIAQIAKRAGVSSATVSKITNPDLTEDVKLKTFMSVLDACGNGDIEIRVLKDGQPLQRKLSDIDIL